MAAGSATRSLHLTLIDPSGYSRPCDHELARALAARGHEVTLVTAAFVHGEAPPPDGYRLTVGDDDVNLAAGDDAGAFYGRATLEQLRREHGGDLPRCEIEDWPDYPVRAVMLDVSRDKVPSRRTLEALIERLASWKVNQVQLYMEHTFAYAGHREVWADASPFTAEEVAYLDRFCAERHVELVPNQNCLGHMGRWLKHERYRPLAMFPDGWAERGRWRPPATIDPANPGSLALVRELLTELLPNFTSRRVQLANLASRHALPMTSATLPMPGARSASTSHGCSRAPRPPTCRSCRRRSSSSSSMRRPRARSASKCHRRSLPAPTR